jgi:23S rRNA (pseudouridine1915-N3)-methyltransferase
VKIVIVAVGRLRSSGLREIADDYLGRIRRVVRCEEIELRDDRELLRRWPDADTVVALEVDGTETSSVGLTEQLTQWGRRGKGEIAFVIGGADGIPSSLSRKADVRLSLSRLTLPHRLARILLVEQVYRALSIMRGEPYARED